MRKRRLKSEGLGFYHCISRVVAREFLLGAEEKEALRDYLRRMEAFSGVKVLTYCLMTNHFHLLIEVPERVEVDEEELKRRLWALYGKREYSEIMARWELWREQGLEQQVVRDQERYRARMYDLSEFMKTVKQRFTQWYNKREGRTGMLWEDRFRSVLVEGSRHALLTIAAYIDLNPIRAGLVSDPKAYRWSGYGEAVGGGAQAQAARAGLCELTVRAGVTGTMAGPAAGTSPGQPWKQVHGVYRVMLYSFGEAGGRDAEGRPIRRGFSAEEVETVLKRKGTLTVGQMLQCRVGYFSRGVAVGSRAFVDQVFEANRDYFSPTRKSGARPMRNCSAGLYSARALQVDAVTLPG